jgi:hypothetical protein
MSAPAPRVWLITEYNCHLSADNHVTIWISGRPLSPDLDLTDDVARPLIGPLPSADAREIAAILKAELETAGVEVIDDTTADD